MVPCSAVQGACMLHWQLPCLHNANYTDCEIDEEFRTKVFDAVQGGLLASLAAAFPAIRKSHRL
eukprot:scaffold43164_cov15-Tisochrysis_lutea.AAC.1